MNWIRNWLRLRRVVVVSYSDAPTPIRICDAARLGMCRTARDRDVEQEGARARGGGVAASVCLFDAHY